jgi:AraC-like DNA-binding protein/TolB-like protein
MNHSSLHKLNEVILENLSDEDFGPEQLAAKMGMSHSALHRKVKEKYNKTISQFIREVRLQKARELLRDEDLSVSEIAYKVGFGSPTYFNKCFHEVYGTAPGEYRKIQENNPKEISVEHAGRQDKGFSVYLYSIPVVILAVIAIIYTTNKISNDDLPLEKTVAVLPVEYLGLPEYSYQGRGAHAAIVNHLSKIKDLVVFEKDSISDQKGYFLSQQAGYYLKLTFLLEMKDILLYAKLMRGDNGQIIWSDRFPRKTEDVFDLYREVAEAVAGKINVTITPEEWNLIEKYSTPNLTAYDYYMQARDLLWNIESADTLRFYKARNLFRDAIKLDSSYAPAYAGISRLYLIYNWWRKFFDDDPMDSALFYANSAIYHDNTLAEAYLSRGEVYSYRGHQEEARSDFDKAIELNPGDWRSYFARGQYHNYNYDILQLLKDFHKAFSLCNSKEKFDILRRIGGVYMAIGYPEITEFYYKKLFDVTKDSLYFLSLEMGKAFAIQKWDKKLEQDLLRVYLSDSTRLNVLEHLVYCRRFTEDYEKALYYFLRYKKIIENQEGLMHVMTHKLGYLYWMTGNYEMANQCFDQQLKYTSDAIREQRPLWKWRYYDLAVVYAFRNERDSAFKYLHKLNSMEFSMPAFFVGLLKEDPLFDNIRHEAEFQKIAAGVESKNMVLKEQVKQWLVENKMYDFSNAL